MKEKIVFVLSIALLTAAALYSVVAFAAWDLNTANWDDSGRGAAAITWFGVVLYVAANAEYKNNEEEYIENNEPVES
jgi:hypothetical protein